MTRSGFRCTGCGAPDGGGVVLVAFRDAWSCGACYAALLSAEPPPRSAPVHTRPPTPAQPAMMPFDQWMKRTAARR